MGCSSSKATEVAVKDGNEIDAKAKGGPGDPRVGPEGADAETSDDFEAECDGGESKKDKA